MNCQIAQNSLSAYLDRELPGDEMIALRTHLSHCYECEHEMESLRAVRSELAALPRLEPREEFVREVMSMVDGVRSPAGRVPFAAVVATSVAAAVFAVLLFNAFFARQSPEQLANDGSGFDAASDAAVTSPDFGGHAPLMPVGR